MKKLLIILMLLGSPVCYSFNYLEHSYISDYSCDNASQKILKKIRSGDQSLFSEYLSLRLMCPQTMTGAYCKDSYKTKRSFINWLKEKPIETGEYSLSFGDLTALADHIASFGPLKNVPRAKSSGLLKYLEEYLGEYNEGADGFIEDVAEDSCEFDGIIDWDRLGASIDKSLKKPIKISSKYLMPLERESLTKSSHDPAGVYTFDNPQYLDMILNNHHHFGDRSYESWLGYHATANSLKTKKCADVYPTEDNCFSFKSKIKNRILLWHSQASSEEQGLFQKIVEELKKDKLLNSKVLEQITSSYLSLVFEAGGIHFLQDNYSGGHLRGNRGDMNLEDARYFHDEDSKHGVIAYLKTSNQKISFLAYGDDYLLSHSDVKNIDSCESTNLSARQASQCLLVKQRELIIGASVSSIMDWAYGGQMYDKACKEGEDIKICEYLPTMSIRSLEHGEGQSSGKLRRADLPQGPPPFTYQSLTFQHAFNKSNDILHSGVNFSLLSRLGSEATWLTSYNLSWNYANGNDYGKNSFEFSYMFHWRWATRFLVNAAPYIEIGEQFKSGNRKLFSGIGTKVGISILPEGWIRMPLEFGLYLKTPLNLFDPESVKTSAAENSQILEISIGLAFL